jgi:hypothetical protein
MLVWHVNEIATTSPLACGFRFPFVAELQLAELVDELLTRGHVRVTPASRLSRMEFQTRFDPLALCARTGPASLAATHARGESLQAGLRAADLKTMRSARP